MNKSLKIKGYIGRDFHSKETNIFMGNAELNKFWQWEGDIIIRNIHCKKDFNDMNIKEGDLVPVEIIIKKIKKPIKNKRNKNEKST